MKATVEDLRRLVRFYLDCIEAEDRRSLTISRSGLHRNIVSPWEAEPLFHPEAAEVPLPGLGERDRSLLRGTPGLGGAQRLLYGYPLLLDAEGFVSPLFLAEVEVQESGNGRFVMRPVEAGRVLLNHHIFVLRSGRTLQEEEVVLLQESLEADFGSFTDRLRAAFEALGEPFPGFAASPLDPWPAETVQGPRWINRPMLFLSERDGFTRHLKAELRALAESFRDRRTLERTALGLLAGLVPSGKADSAVPLVEAVPLNAAQEEAARTALSAGLTVVTGPPGTGKSQLVVDILASCALAGRPVLFASKNNRAVDVVRERLTALLGKEHDWVLRLGTRQTMQRMREELKARLEGLRSAPVPPPPDPDELERTERRIGETEERIRTLRETSGHLAKAEMDLLQAEAQVSEAWRSAAAGWSGPPACGKAEALAEAVAKRLEAMRRRDLVAWILRLFSGLWRRSVRRRLGALVQDFPASLKEEILAEADRREADLAGLCGAVVRLLRWKRAESLRDRLRRELDAFEPAEELAGRLEALKGRRAELERRRLDHEWTVRIRENLARLAHLTGRYFDLAERRRTSESEAVRADFAGTVRSLLPAFPVWVVTNLSARNALPLEAGLFDLVVIDEASQCDIPSAFPLLFRGRRAVVIGDPKQLRHISTIRGREEDEAAARHGVEGLAVDWSYRQRSLYDLCEGTVLAENREPIFLAEHYRSHPEIVNFSNRRFYAGRLIVRTRVGAFTARLREEDLGLFWHDVRGRVPASRHSAWNEAEVKAVVDLFDRWAASGLLRREDLRFGVVTPFRLQMQRLREALLRRPWSREVPEVAVGTAHLFQGNERDVMVLSPVVAQGMSERLVRWVAETEQLLNVAVTRARAALHVVGDREACRAAGGFLAELAEDASAQADGRRPEFESPAEERMAELLDRAGLWYGVQQPFGRYRLDFLVVSPLGRRIDLEVDGRGHRSDEAVRSDAVRDAALRGAGLEVVRVPAQAVLERPEEVLTFLRRLA